MIYVVLPVLFYSLQGLCIKLFNKGHVTSKASFFVFEFGMSLCAGLLFCGSDAQLLKCNPYSWIFGLSFGLCFILNVYFYLMLMGVAPLSISALINSSGMLIPTFTGVILWGEKFKATQFIGLILILICFILTAGLTKNSRGKADLKTLICGLGTFAFCGLSGVFQTAQQKMWNGAHVNEFSAIAFLFASSLLVPVIIAGLYRSESKWCDLVSLKSILLMVGAGLGTYFGFSTLMNSLCRLPAHMVYPAVNGGMIIVLSILSRFLFKEKQNAKSKIGLVVGIAAIIFLSV